MRVSQNLRTSSLSHVTAATMSADQYWRLQRSDCRNTLICARIRLARTLLTCGVDLGSLTLPAPEAGEFVELILLHAFCNTNLYETRNSSVALHGYHLRQTSSQLTNIYVPSCRYKFLYTQQLKMAAR